MRTSSACSARFDTRCWPGASRPAEGLARDGVDLAADMLDAVRQPVDDRIEQMHQRQRRGGAQVGCALGMAGKAVERGGFGIAHGDQVHRGEHKAHRMAFGIFLHDAGGDGRRHVDGVILGIEPARGLDLVHLLQRRHHDAGGAFDEQLLLAAGIEHVDPHGTGRQHAISGTEFDELHLAIGQKGTQHRWTGSCGR